MRSRFSGRLRRGSALRCGNAWPVARLVAGALAAMLVAGSSAAALGQAYPSRPVRVVVAFTTRRNDRRLLTQRMRATASRNG